MIIDDNKISLNKGEYIVVNDDITVWLSAYGKLCSRSKKDLEVNQK